MRRRRGARARSTASWTFVLVNVLFMVAGAAIAAWTLYPVFASMRYVVAVAAAIGAGAVIAVVCERLRLGAGWAAGLAAIAYVVGGLTLAIPGATSGIDSLAGAMVELVRGPITGWKDIVTLPLPLGAYRATLVPVFALFLVGTLLASWAALRAQRAWALGGVAVVGLEVTAIALGPATRADALAWAPLGGYLSREFVVGLATFGVLLAWFGWRAAHARRAALARAHSHDKARLTRAPHLRTAAGGIAVAVMVMLAVATATLVAAPIAASVPREVARTAIEPPLTVDSAVTPLAAFRSYFADDNYDSVLFAVEATDGTPERVRVASLSYFDGETFSASAPPDAAPARFQRVPSSIAAQPGTTGVRTQVTIVDGGGIWVPLVGELGAVTFQGPRRAQLVDGFYYMPEAGAGVMAAEGGVVAGDSYVVRGNVPESGATLERLGAPPGSATIDPDLIPPALSDWVARQEVTRDGAGLAELILRLRERGYLSHALEEPAEGSTPLWQQDLAGYSFAPAAAGHSYDRIERLFIELAEREEQAGNSTSASLVAAVGDEEQFATAAALIAAELGFPSRVVLGARLLPAQGDVPASSPCEAGECRGRHMTAWVEVQGADGSWVAADVTPQYDVPLAPDLTTQRDPEFASALDPERSEAIVPPSTQRGTSTDEEAAPEEPPGAWAWIATALRITAVSLLMLLVLLGPLLGILIWKAVRRRRRRRGEPREAIHHGWDEYLDTAVDAGLEPLPRATRLETALAYGSVHGAQLATVTDRATFSTEDAAPEQADEYWRLIEEDRAAWMQERSWWARLKMRASLRSVWHSVAAREPKSSQAQQTVRPQWRSDHTGATSSRRRTGRATRSRGKRRQGART